MGNKKSWCAHSSSQSDRKIKEIPPVYEERHYVHSIHHISSSQHQIDGHISASTAAIHHSAGTLDNLYNLHHILVREALEGDDDPSVDPTAATTFLERSKVENGGISRKRSQHQIAQQAANSTGGGLKNVQLSIWMTALYRNLI